jgi:hypothetical protein
MTKSAGWGYLYATAERGTPPTQQAGQGLATNLCFVSRGINLGCRRPIEGAFMRAYGRLLVAAILSFALGLGIILPAHAEKDCVGAPTGRAPPGSEWHYHIDQVKQRKCWHLRSRAETAQSSAIVPPPAAKIATPGSEKPANGQSAQGPAAQPPLRGSSVQGSVQQRQAGADDTAWAAQASPTGPDNTAWPDPPPPATAGNVVWPDPPTPIVATKSHDPEDSASNQNIATAGAESQIKGGSAIPSSTISFGAVLLFVVGLIFTGILWGRRYEIQLDQHAPENSEFRQVGAGNLDDSQRALRQLLQDLEHQRG